MYVLVFPPAPTLHATGVEAEEKLENYRFCVNRSGERTRAKQKKIQRFEKVEQKQNKR